MAEVIITAIEGQASLTRFESGETIALTVGVVVYEGDVISTETGTQVTVSVDGQLRILPANTNTTFPLQLDFTDSNSDDEFAVFDESLEALAATLETQPDQSESNTDFLDLLEGEEDILESLEATAAGLDGGAGTEGGSNFVRVGRINEDVNPVGFQFAPNATDNNELEPNNVNGTGEQAQDITIVLDPIGLTSDPTPTVTGTTSAIPGSTVTLTITDSEGNVQTLTTSVTADNTFSADVLEALSDGAFTVDVTVTEPTGNTADNSTTGEIDTTAPLITIDTIGTLSDTTPTITGTTDATAGTTVTLVITDSEGNTQTVTTTVQDDGTYSATVPESLVEGDFIVNASVTDEVGNTATAESAGIINVTPPTITIDSIALGNDTTPTISGTTDAEPGSVVSLTITDSNGNTQVIEATVQVDGSYSADTQVELSDGEFTVLASVTNQIGNTATATAQGEVDTQAPTISINDPGNNGDSTPNISGTTDAAPGSEITIIVTDSSGADQTITTTVLADGTFSIDVPNAVTQGEFSVLASVSDSAGNTAETQANGIFDPSSPVLNVDVTSPTNDATPEISGETDAPAGSNVLITVTDSEGNEQTFTTIVDETGNFSETVPTELNEGDFSVVVSVTTPTGESATVTVTGEIDQTSPVIEISPIGSSNDDTPLIEGTTDALPNTTVTLEITDSNGVVQSVNVLVQEDGTFSVETPEPLAEGDFTVSATVTDAAGNVGTTSINAVIDTSGPSIVIETGSPTNGSEGIGGSSDAPNAEIVVVITDNEGNTVTIVDTTDENGEFNVDIPDSIQEGDIDVEVTVTDDTGNSTTTDATIELDVTPPTVTLTPQAEGNDNTPTISGTTDASTTDDIVITIIDSQGEQQTIITNADENGNFSVDVGEPLNEGSYQVTVEITDEAGNTATVVDNGGIVDTTPPVISLQPQEITNDPTPQISGTTDLAAGTTISITVTDSQNNTQNFDIDVDENGDFNTTVPVELSEGPFTVVVSATDNAGNTASAQDSNGVIDLTAPDAPTIDAGNGTVITGTAEATVPGHWLMIPWMH
ncbi:hypothetical protein BK026_00025 [Alteromonas sp. V450]|uniref:retention module-containing protein n=1 Tax=Alteromonas sp. V450 TaxID=1912139 RepID=UPI0008FF4ECD|nr:retention module-containing protein [Alteromonas sp. V450]OJF67314.1 hypothetical protein BK026_00025 [Alteromonas sp. V450]